MQETYNPTWDLESIFPGGSTSEAYANYVEKIKNEIKALSEKLAAFDPQQEKIDEELVQLIDSLEETMIHNRQSGAFVSCLSAQDVNDEHANILVGDRGALGAAFSAVMTDFKAKIQAIPDESWKQIFENPKLKNLEYILNEYRQQAKELLPSEQEVIVNDLA